MSSPLNNSNSPNNIRQPQSFAIGQTAPVTTEEEKKSTKDVGDIKEMGTVPFAVSTSVHRNQLISSSASRSSLTNSIPPDTMPPLSFFALLLNCALEAINKNHPPHMRNLARKCMSVSTYGLLTLNRANRLGVIVSMSMDLTKKNSRVCFNFIHKRIGINPSLTNKARGGFSVALEREASDPLKGKGSSLSEEERNELSERAHQTILVRNDP